MANNGDLELIATLDESSSEAEILKGIKKLNRILKANTNAKIKLDADIDINQIKKELNRLQVLLQTKTQNSANINIKGKIDNKGIITSIKNAMYQAQNIANNNSINLRFNIKKDKLINDIKIMGQQNSKMFTDASMASKYGSLLDNAKLATSNRELKNLRLQLSAMRSELKATNMSGHTLGNTLKKTFKRATELFTGTGGVLLLTHQLKEAWNESLNLDKSFTDLIKVQDELSRSDYPDYLELCNKKAQDLATTQQGLIDGVAEFSKSGYDLTTSNKLTEQSTILSNVGEMNATDSAKAIISGVQAYDEVHGYTDTIEKAKALIDSYNEIGNTASITSAEIAKGVQAVGSVFADANTSVDQFISLLAAGNRQFQNPDSLALGLRTTALKIRASKAELEEMGEDTEGMITSVSELQNKIKALTDIDGVGGKEGISILTEDEKDFRSIYDIFLDISKVYKDMSGVDQSALLSLITTKHRASGISAVLNNMSEAQEIYERSLNSAGSAQREYEKYLGSSEASLNKFRASMIETYQSVLNGQTTKGILDVGNATLQFINSLRLVESGLKGVIAIGVFKVITNLSTAFKTSALQASNFGKALKYASNVPEGNLKDKFSTLKNIAIASKSLTDVQLKQVLSSKALNNEDRIRILRLTGMEKSLAQAKLAEMGLTQATNAQNVAQKSATISAFSLSGAIKGFGYNLRALFISNPIGISIMALSTIFGVVSSKISEYNENLKETRQSNMDSAISANEKAEELGKLYQQYTKLNEITNRTSSQEEQFKQVVLDITKALDDKASALEGLTTNTDDYTDALNKATKAELESQYVTAKIGAGAAKDELKDIAYSNWDGSHITIQQNERMTAVEEHMAALNAVKDILSDYEDEGRNGLEWEPINWDENQDDMNTVIEYYQALIKAREKLVTSDDSDFLMSSDIYKDINNTINILSDSIDKYTKQQYNALKLNYEWQNGIPTTNEEFGKMKDAILDTSGAGKEFQNILNGYLNEDFASFSENIKEEIESSVNDTQTVVDSLSKSFKDFWNSIGNTEKATDLKEELFKLASTGELTGSKLKSLAESNELLKSAMDSSGLSADKLAEKIRELNIDNIESDIKSFADALDKVKNKQSLTAEETSKLILADNSLAGSVKKTKDGYLIEKDALSKVIDTHKEKYNVAVSYEINETKNTIDRISERIKAYQKEIEALKEVSKARDDLGGTTSGSYSDTLAQLELEKKRDKDKKKLKASNKKLKELESSLNNIDTSSTSKSSGSNSNSKSSKIFDYIQIKISRLERLHSKYLDKASDGTKTLTERTKNYNKVLSITDKQINAQDKAIARYNKQLKKIGLDESIAKKIRDGAFDIDTLKGKKKDKAEKYQDIYEKKLDAQDKKYDLKTGKSETERNKYQVELDALENKRKAEESISDELKNQIELKERIGDKNTSSDYSAVNESILKQINNYKKQIPILEKQLGTVKKGSDKWYEYKEAIDSVKDSISGLTQEMMDNATKGIEAIQNASDEYLKSLDDEDALNNAKKENALTADEKNGYIQSTIDNIAKRKTKYAQDSLSYLNEKNNSVNLINATSKKVQKSEGSVFATISSLVNSGQKIPEDILNQVTDANLLTNCYAYNSAITAYETNEATRKLYDETSKTDIRNAVIDKGNVIKDEYDNKSAALSRDEAKTEARIKENEAKGIGQSSNDYREQIAQSQERQQNYIAEKQRLEELLNQELALGHIIADENDPAYKFLMDSISECDTEISNCIVSQTNYNKAIKEMNVENYKTAISLLDSMIDKYKRLQSLADVHNSKLSDEDILAQIGLNDEKIAENNKYLSTIKDNIRTYLTDELHMSAENVEEFINLMENSPHKLRGFMNDLGFKDFNEKTFPDLNNNLNEFNSTMNENTALMVDQENQLDSLAQKRIDTLNEYLEALKKQKDYKDRIFAIEKAQYDLEKAKNNLTKKVWDGQQWVYTADTEAVQSAQESLDNAKFDEFNNSIQDLIDVLEQFIKDFNIYDDNGNMINKPEVILKKGVLGEYTIADIDKIFTDKVLDTSKLSGLMSNIQYAMPNVSIPNINLPEIQRNTGGVHNHYDNIELVLPNITDASTGADLAKSFVNELKNLPSYAKQYDWNR